ncbi:MAG: response regulator transcription factor [Lachnospiraceae bacterium]|nr:response regulator transcription factor [Lachnospiraceae bacterium]
MKKIGILEDDEVLGRELQYFLESNGYEARWIAPKEYEGKRTEDLIRLLISENLHLLLLDIGLPGVNGSHLCKEFRTRSEVPVIMITSKNDELTELMSINNGADDFVAKPFNPQILVAHMESVLRRAYKSTVNAEELHIVQEVTDAQGQPMRQEFVFEPLKGRITNDERTVELSKNELQILKSLVKRQGEIVSRDDIINALWDNCMFVDDNTLTVNMTRLKGKLEDIGIFGAIVTKRGMGYQLV